MPQPQRLHPSTSESPPLAVWAIADLSNDNDDQPLPAQLLRRLVTHYSDPGDLVLTLDGQQQHAAQLNRRALPLEPLLAAYSAPVTNVRRLPAASAQLVLLPETDVGGASPLDRIARLLAPGGFLVIAPAPAGRPALAETIAHGRAAGLRYWQHLIAFVPTQLDRGRGGRCHRDLLVFHRPAAAAAAAAAQVAA